MIISNDSHNLDAGKFLDYIKKNLSSDVAQLVAVRDELAKRQGALSAVDEANKTKADADKYAATKKEAADALLAKAEGKNAEVDIKLVNIQNGLKDLEDKEASFTKTFSKREKDLSALAVSLASKEEALTVLQNTLANDKAKLDADRAALEARIKAFQDKVASINV